MATKRPPSVTSGKPKLDAGKIKAGFKAYSKGQRHAGSKHK